MKTRTKAQLEEELENTLIEVESLRQSAINLTKEVHQVRSLNADLAERLANADLKVQRMQGEIGVLISQYNKQVFFLFPQRVMSDLRRILYPQK